MRQARLYTSIEFALHEKSKQTNLNYFFLQKVDPQKVDSIHFK